MNLSKSELVPGGALTYLTGFADILGCKVGALPMSYLGLPYRKCGKTTSGVEEVVSIQRWKDDLNQEHVIFHSYLLYVIVYIANFLAHYLLMWSTSWRNFKAFFYGEVWVIRRNSIWWIGVWYAPLLKRAAWVLES